MTSVQLTILKEDENHKSAASKTNIRSLLFLFTLVCFTILLTINLLCIYIYIQPTYSTKSFPPLSIHYANVNHQPTQQLQLTDDSPRQNNILYVQSWHDFLSIAPNGDLTHLPTRAACYARLHNYSYVLHMGNHLWNTNFKNRMQFANLTVSPSSYWMRLLIFISAFERPKQIFDHPGSPQHLMVQQKNANQFDWVLYTDLDNVVMNSSVPLEPLIERWQKTKNEENQSNNDCWIFVQDSPHTINTGWILVRKSVQALELLYLWLDQWYTYGNKDIWVKDQGPFQESVLLWISQHSDSRYQYQKNRCWTQGYDAHGRNLCYREVMESWNMTVYNRSYKGLCFLPQTEHVNSHFVHHNLDYFLHTDAVKNVSKFKSEYHPTQGHFNHKAAIFNDRYCPLDGSQTTVPDDLPS